MSRVDIRSVFSVRSQQTPAADCPLSLDAIAKQAKQAIKNGGLAKSHLQKANDALASKIGEDPGNCVVMGPLKEEQRIIQKAIARYDGDVSQVSDVVRSRMRVSGPSQVKDMKDALGSPDFRESLLEKGVKILYVEDCFERPKNTGWRGLVIKYEIDLGKGRSQKAETICHPRGWFQDYETTHTYLENIRALKDMAKAQNRDLTEREEKQIKTYENMAKDIHDGLSIRDGYDVLETKTPSHLSLIQGFSGEDMRGGPSF